MVKGRGPDACFSSILHSRQSAPRRPTGDRIPHLLNGSSSLVAGKKAGNFSEFGPFLRKSVSKTSAKPVSCERIPYADSRELFRARRELIPRLAPGAGNLARKSILVLRNIKLRQHVPMLAERHPSFSGGRPSGTDAVGDCRRPLRGRLPLSRRAPADGRGEASQNLGGRGGVERWRRRRATE